MALNGISVEQSNTTAKKAGRFLYGISIGVDVTFTAIKAVDYSGRGVRNVKLSANNAGGFEEVVTDNQGNSAMQLDNPITINASVGGLRESYNYTGETSLTITMDSKIME